MLCVCGGGARSTKHGAFGPLMAVAHVWASVVEHLLQLLPAQRDVDEIAGYVAQIEQDVGADSSNDAWVGRQCTPARHMCVCKSVCVCVHTRTSVCV